MDQLLNGEFEKPLELEQPNHRTRLETLARVKERYFEDQDAFLEIELSVS